MKAPRLALYCVLEKHFGSAFLGAEIEKDHPWDKGGRFVLETIQFCTKHTVWVCIET